MRPNNQIRWLIILLNKKKPIMVLSQKLAGYLMFNGFVLINVRKDKTSDRNVFFFNDTEQIHKYIDEYNK